MSWCQHSRRVLVEGCDIVAGNDAICLKSGFRPCPEMLPTADVLVRSNVLYTVCVACMVVVSVSMVVVHAATHDDD